MVLASTFEFDEALLTLVVTDAQQQTRTARISIRHDLYLPASADTEITILDRAAAIMTAYKNCTGGAVESATVHLTANSVALEDPALASPWDSDDVVNLLFKTTDGSTTKVTVPMPSDVFLADQETVDPTDATIAALITAIIDGAGKLLAVAVVEYVRGWRDGRKRRGYKLGVPQGA